MRAAPGQGQHDGHGGGDGQHGADDVEAVLAALPGEALQGTVTDREREDPQGQVGEKDQPPV